MLDEQDHYTGPLPTYCGHRHKKKLIASQSEIRNGAEFPTKATAAYPTTMCHAVANVLMYGAAEAKSGRKASTEEGDPPKGQRSRYLAASSRSRNGPRSKRNQTGKLRSPKGAQA